MLTMEITRLIERCRKGDADALGELYKAYARQMRGVCRRYISDEQTVDDVLHDAFIIIFTSFDRLRDVRRAEAWMTAITKNVASKCKDHLAAFPTVSLDETNEAELIADEHEGIGNCQPSPTVKGVPLSEVVNMIDRLPEGYGQVFHLSVFEGMSHKEIADMLGIEPHSSSSQLARAKKMLRKMMRQYWVAVLLLLLMPLTFHLFRKGDTSITNNDRPAVAKQKESEEGQQTLSEESPKKQAQEPVITQRLRRGGTSGIIPVHRTTAITTDTLPSLIAQEQIITDTISNDTTKTTHKAELPHHDMTELFPDKPVTGIKNEKRWSLELAYAGRFDEQNSYNQPFNYKPYTDPRIQYSPGEGPTYVVPGSIDNWTDYAIYLANNPGIVSDKTRSAIMSIALSNANSPGDDKLMRTSHHRMPITWSLTLKYKLNNRFGLESGLSYSRLSSDFEMGTDGNSIREKQTIHYLGIPMKGVYNMYETKLVSLYGSLGLTTEIPVRSILHTDYYLNGQYEASDKTTFHTPWQFSTTFGLGLQYHLTPHVGFFIEPSLQYFIPMKTDIQTYRTEHPFMFTLPLGFRFTW